jgi:superfamily II DNA helicase RecQ
MAAEAFSASLKDEADSLAAAETTMIVEPSKRKRENNEDDDNEPLWSKKARNGTLPSKDLANRVLKERFGLPSFRLKQEAVVTRLLDGESAVVVFPTGAGKSLCYQVSSLRPFSALSDQ